MIDQELLTRLDQWHEENQHKKILQEIEGLPREIRGEYEIQGRLARALNNVGSYEEAIRVLESVREAGAGDDRWWSRMGFAFYQLDRYDEARKHFLRARELNPENQDAKSFLIWLGVGTNGAGEKDWSASPNEKPRPRSDAKPNGWERRSGETVPPAPKPRTAETGNGWEQKKAPARVKPRTPGSGNDWEGRGWEGTALLETALFGVLRFPVKEGLFQTFPLPLRGKSRMVDLYIREDLARPALWKAMEELLNRVPELCEKAWAKIQGDRESNEVIALFLRDRQEKGVEGAPEPFIDALEPRGITLVPGENGGLGCDFGFSPDSEDDGERLVIRFDQKGEITGICRES